ncbi:MAG: ABC transporter permease subunit/CPBP intramembrane protease [Planctomycetota bacterium]
MIFPHRIRTIYWKELIDILRDRRTLVAMVVVPIVLYPLLMLGSVQAVSHQTKSLEHEDLVLGVVDDGQRGILSSLIVADAEAIRSEAPAGEAPPDDENAPQPLAQEKIQVFASRDELEEAIRQRVVPVGVIFVEGLDVHRADLTHRVLIVADYEEPRGISASRRIQEMLRRTEERIRGDRLAGRGLPPSFVEPLDVATVDLSNPSSVLGAVLPLILVLMTITGAIYPAIDLTAGERERGTLETLMVCPVPVIDLIVGKFMVVTTVAVVGAALNLASVTATVYFGGFDRIIAARGEGLPLAQMAFILVALIPFAVFMSAIMIAVCSFARTFKEAQNYVTPVILAVLVPGGIAAFPATRLEGVMLVLPVGNMVALAKELLLGAAVPVWQMAIVIVSTSLYAAAAIAAAANIFGKESVVFADAGSWRGTFARARLRVADRPSPSLGLLLVAVLFPIWFFVQSTLSPAPGHDARGLLWGCAVAMPVLFALLPVLLLAFRKVRIAAALSLRMASTKDVLGATLIGASAWVVAHEVNVFQAQVLGVPQQVVESAAQLGQTLSAMPLVAVLLTIAVVPAVCEELLFRGLLLSSLLGSTGPWRAILVSAAVFAAYHFFFFKAAVTGGLGILLGYLCWRSRSIVPSMLAHLLHNALGALSAVRPEWFAWMDLPGDADPEGQWSHLPVRVIVVGLFVFVLGIVLIALRSSETRRTIRPAPAPTTA